LQEIHILKAQALHLNRPDGYTSLVASYTCHCHYWVLSRTFKKALSSTLRCSAPFSCSEVSINRKILCICNPYKCFRSRCWIW